MYAIISKDKNNGFEILQTVEINHYFFCLKCPSVILEFNAKVGKKSLRNWLNLVWNLNIWNEIPAYNIFLHRVYYYRSYP